MTLLHVVAAHTTAKFVLMVSAYGPVRSDADQSSISPVCCCMKLEEKILRFGKMGEQNTIRRLTAFSRLCSSSLRSVRRRAACWSLSYLTCSLYKLQSYYLLLIEDPFFDDSY